LPEEPIISVPKIVMKNNEGKKKDVKITQLLQKESKNCINVIRDINVNELAFDEPMKP
jgi:hypothetical protein